MPSSNAAVEVLPEGHAVSFGRVTFEPVTDSGRWAALLAQVELPHSVQAFGYGQAKAGRGWAVNRQLLVQDGRPVAIVQALERRVLGLRLATRINRAPMFLAPQPTSDLVVAVYRAIRNHWGRLPFGILLIAPALEDTPDNRALMLKAGFRRRQGNGWGSARLDLGRETSALFDSFEHNWRKSIRSGIKAGVTVQAVDTEADHEWMVERHLANMAEKGFSGHDATFLRTLRHQSGSDYVLFQARHEGEPVAGLVILRFGDVADSVVAWFGDKGRKAKAGNVITWAAIEEMQKRGCLFYDVGGTNSDKGFSSFKAGMNGAPYLLLGEYISF